MFYIKSRRYQGCAIKISHGVTRPLQIHSSLQLKKGYIRQLRYFPPDGLAGRYHRGKAMQWNICPARETCEHLFSMTLKDK